MRRKNDGQQSLFGDPPGEVRKQAGLDSVEEHNCGFVELMRQVARQVAQEKGNVTCDHLRVYARQHGIAPGHPNAWGAIFRGEEWVLLGWVKSAIPSNHARSIRVWGLRNGA